MKLTWFWRCFSKLLEGAFSRKSPTHVLELRCSVFQDPFGCSTEALRVVASLEVSFQEKQAPRLWDTIMPHLLYILVSFVSYLCDLICLSILILWGWRGFHSRMVKSHHTDRAGKGQRNSISGGWMQQPVNYRPSHHKSQRKRLCQLSKASHSKMKASPISVFIAATWLLPL